MDDLLKRNPMLAALAAAALLLVAALGYELFIHHPGGSAGNPRKAALAEAKLLPPIPVAAVEQAYPETAARPLFTPTRRPAPEPANAGQQPAFVKGQFVLLGVTIAGDTRIALLREKSTGHIVRAARGGEVNGLKVAVVEPETVTLALGAEQEQLPLTVQKAGAPGTPGHPNPGAAPAPAASAVVQGPFGPAGAAAVVRNPAPVPGPGFGGGPGFPIPPGAPGGVPMPGMVPGTAPPVPASASPANDPNAGLSPEEILARRRARRAQQSQ